LLSSHILSRKSYGTSYQGEEFEVGMVNKGNRSTAIYTWQTASDIYGKMIN
jgi:hypothetical protein